MSTPINESVRRQELLRGDLSELRSSDLHGN